VTTFVRVKDRHTKHEFDVPEGDKRIGVAFDVVKGTRYPPVTRVRAPKHHVKLAGRPASRETASSSEAPAEASTPKEN
jgi:hypothetical protein